MGMLPKLSFICLLLISPIGLAFAAETPSPALIGASVRIGPEYDGSRSTDIGLIPVLMYSKDLWFARTTEGILEAGAKAVLFGNLNYGIQAAYEEGRDSHNADFLQMHHVDSLDPSLSLGGFLQYQNIIKSVPVDILARYRKDIDSSRGDQVDLRVTAGIYRSKDKKLNAEIFAQSTWANDKAIQSYYGINNDEAFTTKLSEFHPSGGNLSNEFGFWCSYNLSSHWMLMGNVERHQLEGDAKNSPLTEVSHNNYFSFGAAYQY
jgi:outer membrane scaffolding protein for murein synthesis (MipA/OmpV family)